MWLWILLIIVVFLVMEDRELFGVIEMDIKTDELEKEKVVKVSIVNFEYVPQVLKIKPGTTVAWINYDPEGHTVTSEKGNFLDSELLDEMEIYRKKFNKEGDYGYYCIPHPYMTGKVIVEKN